MCLFWGALECSLVFAMVEAKGTACFLEILFSAGRNGDWKLRTSNSLQERCQERETRLRVILMLSEWSLLVWRLISFGVTISHRNERKHREISWTFLGRSSLNNWNLLICMVYSGTSANEFWARYCEWNELQQSFCPSSARKNKSRHEWTRVTSSMNSWQLIQIIFAKVITDDESWCHIYDLGTK